MIRVATLFKSGAWRDQGRDLVPNPLELNQGRDLSRTASAGTRVASLILVSSRFYFELRWELGSGSEPCSKSLSKLIQGRDLVREDDDQRVLC